MGGARLGAGLVRAAARLQSLLAVTQREAALVSTGLDTVQIGKHILS